MLAFELPKNPPKRHVDFNSEASLAADVFNILKDSYDFD